ncbi:hypothetical protein BDZ91DRAFT_726553 [Kalaharituber pfeilii]|nr:hypothetical protein BDZ91DRAFT_726553 [Kalaharituber pfeilii]
MGNGCRRQRPSDIARVDCSPRIPRSIDIYMLLIKRFQLLWMLRYRCGKKSVRQL